MIRRPPRSTPKPSSAASDVYKRQGDNTQGDFDGQVRSINNDGVMVTATLQGIWKREGKIVNMYTLDTFSDGGMIYAEGKVDLVEGTLKFKAFEF